MVSNLVVSFMVGAVVLASSSPALARENRPAPVNFYSANSTVAAQDMPAPVQRHVRRRDEIAGSGGFGSFLLSTPGIIGSVALVGIIVGVAASGGSSASPQ